MAKRTTQSTPKKPRRWKQAFLEQIAKLPNVSLACSICGIERTTPYQARRKDPKFASDWDAAEHAAIESLEQEAWRRAHGRVREIKSAVRLTGNTTDEPDRVEIRQVEEWSDLLMIFLLKANKPGKYRENFDYRRLSEAIERIRSGNSQPADRDSGNGGSSGSGGSETSKAN